MELFGRTGQRVVAYGVAALILYQLGIQAANVMPWCLLIIVGVIEFLSYQHGVIQGVLMYRSLDPVKKIAFDKMIDAADTTNEA